VSKALKAYDKLKAEGISIRVVDAYSVQPIDRATLQVGANATGGVVLTVEDHYSAGGLGDAVSEALASSGVVVERLCVREIPRSGEPDELIDKFGISARHVVEAVKRSRKPARA
jgi:transketolase